MKLISMFDQIFDATNRSAMYAMRLPHRSSPYVPYVVSNVVCVLLFSESTHRSWAASAVMQ
jgi:hypothetical protein